MVSSSTRWATVQYCGFMPGFRLVEDAERTYDRGRERVAAKSMIMRVERNLA
jgi:hypothetical protein